MSQQGMTESGTAPNDALAADRLNWALEAYARSAKALIRAGTLEEMAMRVCEAVVAHDAYLLAGILLVDVDGQQLEYIARSGRAADYIHGLEISIDASLDKGRGPTGRALRTGSSCVMDDSLCDPAFAPWRARASRFGIRSSVTAPFMLDGRVAGAITVYAAQPRAFTPSEVRIFEELGEELAFAMSVLRDKQRLKAAQEAQRAAESELRARREELARIGRMLALGQFAASIAHEIAQPLTATITNIEAAQRFLAMAPARGESAGAALDRALRDAARAAGVVANIRQQMLDRPVAYAPTDINATIAAVVDFLGDELAAGGITVRTALAPGLPPVLANQPQLLQVLSNLFANAREAMVDNGDRPRLLDLASFRDADGMVVIEITDNGCGIAPEVARRLFEPLFTTRSEGMGLGLAISRGVVEAHGGTIALAPAETGGTRFRISLPPHLPGQEENAGAAA